MNPENMPNLHGTHEIIESKHVLAKTGHKYCIEDDINQLFEAIDVRTSRPSWKNASKKPIRVSSSQASGIGISESASLKQALRGLCISQASELAAMKRLSKPASSSGVLEAGAIKKLYRAVVVEESKGNLVEISLVPQSNTPNFPEKVDEIVHEKPNAEMKRIGKPKPTHSLLSSSVSPRLLKPMFRNKNFIKKKLKPDLTSGPNSPSPCERKVDNALGPSTAKSRESEKASPSSSSTTNLSIEVNSSVADPIQSKPGRIKVRKNDDKSRSREKGEFSQSSKSSIGEYSSSTTTSISEESNLSGSSRGGGGGNRPHMSKDLRWEGIRYVQKQHGSLGLRHFKLVKKLGSGDIGTIYLAELTGTSCLFALKVMDNEYLVSRKKMSRAQTEREILQMLDHPFLPTLYAHFTTDKHSCLVMEYCPGGDLHVLRQKQPSRSFSEQAARFYVAEVLLALEYLHMLGVIYRDLKPENILVREDGHIMLSDFDLSLRCNVNPTLLQSTPIAEPTKKLSSTPCIDPFCLQPSWQVPCFTPRLLSIPSKTRKSKPDSATTQVSPLPQLVVEPTTARSNSFVGTHEYLAPEIIKGEGHGSAVDWWTYGIFLYELLYGKTPFKGSGNDDTLANVVSRSLRFPENTIVSSQAKDLIRGLLVKEPENRLGFVKGAAEIKQHQFFEGLNWALIRCAIPPEFPNPTVGSRKKEKNKSSEFEEF